MTGARTALVQDVVRASEQPELLRELVRTVGGRAVAEVLLDEVRFRATPPVNKTGVVVELVIADGDERWDFHLWAERDRPIEVVDAGTGFVGMRIEYDLTDLATELYGPVRERPAGTRGTRLFPLVAEDPGLSTMITYFMAAQQASQAVVDGCTSDRPSIGDLSARYGTPKFGSLHWFAPHYDRHFRERRGERLRILEIGIGGYRAPNAGGGSLLLWKHYFPRAHVFGLDIADKSHIDEARVTVLQGDQGDAAFLDALAREHGPFDIVIDDGSHLNGHVRTSFGALFGHVRNGGLYVIEDVWTSYWSGFGGSADPADDGGTSLGLVKSIVDAIQHQERPSDPPHEPSTVDRSVVGMHVYHNLVFVEKGRNDEGGVPGWIPRDFDSLSAAASGETV